MVQELASLAGAVVLRVNDALNYISKKSLNFENSRVLQSAPEFGRVLKVQRFFADVGTWAFHQQ